MNVYIYIYHIEGAINVAWCRCKIINSLMFVQRTLARLHPCHCIFHVESRPGTSVEWKIRLHLNPRKPCYSWFLCTTWTLGPIAWQLGQLGSGGSPADDPIWTQILPGQLPYPRHPTNPTNPTSPTNPTFTGRASTSGQGIDFRSTNSK